MPLTATASAVAERVAGRTRLTAVRSQVPLSLRETADGLTVLASAFTPLGGDRTRLEVTVGPGAELAVGSAAAQVAQPGPRTAVSRAAVALAVATGGSLRYHLQPLVVAAGAEHRFELELVVTAGGRALVVDTVVLGRSGPPGRYRSSWRVTAAGRPLLHTDLDVGTGAPDGWDGPAGIGRARVLVTALLVGAAPPGAPRPDDLLCADLPVDGGRVMRLAGPGVLLSWLGSDPVAARRAVAAFLAAHLPTGSPQPICAAAPRR